MSVLGKYFLRIQYIYILAAKEKKKVLRVPTKPAKLQNYIIQKNPKIITPEYKSTLFGQREKGAWTWAGARSKSTF